MIDAELEELHRLRRMVETILIWKDMSRQDLDEEIGLSIKQINNALNSKNPEMSAHTQTVLRKWVADNKGDIPFPQQYRENDHQRLYGHYTVYRTNAENIWEVEAFPAEVRWDVQAHRVQLVAEDSQGIRQVFHFLQPYGSAYFYFFNVNEGWPSMIVMHLVHGSQPLEAIGMALAMDWETRTNPVYYPFLFPIAAVRADGAQWGRYRNLSPADKEHASAQRLIHAAIEANSRAAKMIGGVRETNMPGSLVSGPTNGNGRTGRG